MGESEWKHAGWVSGLGKWAWIVLLVQAAIRIVAELGTFLSNIAAWLTAQAAWVSVFSTPYPVAMPLGPLVVLIWGLIGAIISLVVTLIIIRPKFSKPCGDKDWDTLYEWTLSLGSLRVPWMFIWGAIFAIFSWYSAPAIFIILPAVMLIFAGPKKYNWTSGEE